jgi:hypothetical protein
LRECRGRESRQECDAGKRNAISAERELDSDMMTDS